MSSCDLRFAFCQLIWFPLRVHSIFIDPQTKLLRSGWRILIFLFLVLLPFALILLASYLSSGHSSSAQRVSGEPEIAVNSSTIITYVVQVAWLLIASGACLKYLEQMRLASLGFGFYRGCWREIWLGLVIAALMMVAVVALQAVGGGTRLMLNPLLWKTADGVRSFDFIGLGMIGRNIGLGLILLALAAAFEELLFRGYPFQTMLRGGIPPVIPIVLLSAFFGIMHLGNPSSTMFSTMNTILAGIWLAVAYLKTRSLWFPTALHLGWNWTMGAFFGIPVSGLKLIRYPIFIAANEAPLWLSGGSYGCEGGVAATIILVIATLVIWKAKWLQIAPTMQAALSTREAKNPATMNLGLSDN